MALYKHLKRGTIYEVLSTDLILNTFSEEGTVHLIPFEGREIQAIFQCSKCVLDGSRYGGPITFYRGTDDQYWIRPTFEFNDGRFEEIK